VAEAKRTAMLAALARAAAHANRDPAVRGPDHLAIRYLGPPWTWVVRFAPVRRLVEEANELRLPGIYGFAWARTRYIDEVVAAELTRGLEQLVILGAGYDTRAFRYDDRLRGARVFEVDLPATSARERRLMPAAVGSAPDNLTFVPIDFNREALVDRLPAAGYDARRRTLFLWEGVSFYVTAQAVDAVLALVAGATPGSAVVFDYLHRGALEGARDFYGARSIPYFAARGEPFIFGLDAARLAEFVAARGLELIAQLEADELERRYLTSSAGKRVRRAAGCFGIAYARRPPS
jgi:methyltransferase (TIGR00027 family)